MKITGLSDSPSILHLLQQLLVKIVNNRFLVVSMTLLEALSEIKDSRRKEGRRYELKYILLFGILAVTCGAKGYSDMAVFIEKKFVLLKKIFNLRWYKPPTHSTIHKIISEVDPDEMEKAFRKFSKGLIDKKGGDSGDSGGSGDSGSKIINLAIDGKALKNSYNNKEDKSSQNLLSAFDSKELIILAHLDIPNKESEMKATQKMIDELSGDCGFKFLLTTDALHTQKKL